MIPRSLASFCSAVILMLMVPADGFAQAGCSLSTPNETIRIGHIATFLAGSLPLTATGSCPSSGNLDTSTTASWLNASGWISPPGAGISFYPTESNFTGAPRTAVIVVNGQALITVTQGTAPCVSGTTTHTFPATGGTGTIQVETTTPDCFWNVTGFPFAPPPALPLRPGWLVPNGVIATVGPGSFGVKASSNAFSLTERSVTLTVGGSTTVTISQLAATCRFTISPASISVPANGGSATVSLTGTGTDCAYTALPATGSEWVTVTAGASGNAPATISVTVGPNPNPYARTGQIIAVNGVLGIAQAGSPITLDTGKTFYGNVLSFGAARQPTGTVRVTSSEPVLVTNSVEPNASWTATASQPWIVVTPASGATPATMHVSIDPVVLASQSPGILSGFIDVFSSTAPQTPQRLNVGATYYNGVPGSQEPFIFGAAPFGVVDTPTEGATGLAGAVPISGWAIDRVGITAIRIYRESVVGEPQGRVYIGDAVRVFGARPDLPMSYGGFPESRLGGWGLMVLSNLLPGGGNGTYTFLAYAQDFEGNDTLLGTKTVAFDNATATKPFGTIDTPSQGGVASGTTYVNFGWVLTPQPKTIAKDGSTITVLIDGVPSGTVDYNHPRSDIQNAFPGLNNTNGAIGYKTIDTSLLTNGLHTISWTVVDDAGSVEGIGSRFFSVANGSGALTTTLGSAASSPMTSHAESIAAAPLDDAPLLARRGWDLNAPWRWFPVGAGGHAVIRGEEIDRFEFQLGAQTGQTYTGYLRVGSTRAPLPAGSRLDPATGTFTWAPGVGFVGTYDLEFLRGSGTQVAARQAVRVILAPKGNGHIGAQLAIDAPRTGEVVTQPFLFGGWAADLDATTGSGIDTVHVWAYPATGGPPIFLGTPALGGARPDVAAAHGEQFSDSAFNLSVQGLAPGVYDLAAFPWSNVTSAFAPAKSVRVTAR